MTGKWYVVIGLLISFIVSIYAIEYIKVEYIDNKQVTQDIDNSIIEFEGSIIKEYNSLRKEIEANEEVNTTVNTDVGSHVISL